MSGMESYIKNLIQSGFNSGNFAAEVTAVELTNGFESGSHSYVREWIFQRLPELNWE